MIFICLICIFCTRFCAPKKEEKRSKCADKSGKKEEEDAHEDQEGVDVVPAIGEEDLGADADDADEEFQGEDPDEDVIEGREEGLGIEGEVESVYEGKDDEDGDD